MIRPYTGPALPADAPAPNAPSHTIRGGCAAASARAPAVSVPALEVDGNGAGAVPELVGVAGYRIVQEALTNVARHAGPRARARVKLTRRNGLVEVEVRDDGRGTSAAVQPGGGLTGMRERAAAVGGRFDAGGAPGGGFRVWASLPAAGR
jgi:signal transduction histidine kinase